MKALRSSALFTLLVILTACNSSSESTTTNNPSTELAIGDSYQGGYIFELNEDAVSGLICATADNSSSLEWGGSGITIGVGAESATDGASNTQAIVTALGAGTIHAAGLCDAYEVDSQGNTPCQVGNTCYTNWYLPSYQEMGRLFQQSTQLTLQNAALGGPIEGIEAANYKSSTESSDTHSWIINAASLGNAEVELKNVPARVRCIRSF